MSGPHPDEMSKAMNEEVDAIVAEGQATTERRGCVERYGKRELFGLALPMDKDNAGGFLQKLGAGGHLFTKKVCEFYAITVRYLHYLCLSSLQKDHNDLTKLAYLVFIVMLRRSGGSTSTRNRSSCLTMCAQHLRQREQLTCRHAERKTWPL